MGYLNYEGDKVARCLRESGDRSCYSFNTEVMFVKEPYKEEDMIMKYPRQYHVVANVPEACADNPQIVIGTPVGPQQFVERMATRMSWGGVKDVNGTRVKHLFFCGQNENDPEEERHIREENEVYHDIVQFDMNNSFMNLTLLAILTYNWTSVYCPNIQYYIRADNDMWNNPYVYLPELIAKNYTNAIIGTPIVGSRPARFRYHRYYISEKVFPGNKFLPYVAGCFVVLPRDVLGKIVEYSSQIGPVIYFDDVFLGQIADKANITLVPMSSRLVFGNTIAFTSSFYDLWAMHRIGPADRIALWGMQNNLPLKNESCVCSGNIF